MRDNLLFICYLQYKQTTGNNTQGPEYVTNDNRWNNVHADVNWWL